MTKGQQLTENLLYLINTWYDEGELTDFDYKNYTIVAEGGTLKQKKMLWHDLTGSTFEFE